MAIVFGMLRLQKFQFIDVYREETFTGMKAIVKQVREFNYATSSYSKTIFLPHTLIYIVSDRMWKLYLLLSPNFQSPVYNLLSIQTLLSEGKHIKTHAQ